MAVAPGLLFVDASLLYTRGETTVLDITWREGRDEHCDMRVSIGKA